MMPSGKARVVLDLGGDGELAAGLHAFDDQRLELGARGVDGRGEPGGAGTDDDDLVVPVGHVTPDFENCSRAINVRTSLDSEIRLRDCQRFRGRSLYWFCRGALSIPRAKRRAAFLSSSKQPARGLLEVRSRLVG